MTMLTFSSERFFIFSMLKREFNAGLVAFMKILLLSLITFITIKTFLFYLNFFPAEIVIANHESLMKRIIILMGALALFFGSLLSVISTACYIIFKLNQFFSCFKKEHRRLMQMNFERKNPNQLFCFVFDILKLDKETRYIRINESAFTQMLLAEKDLNYQNSDGDTVSHLILKHFPYSPQIHTLILLNADFEIPNNRGETALKFLDTHQKAMYAQQSKSVLHNSISNNFQKSPKKERL